ncbi:class I SAM-dependent methyltransferase [Mesorhizobium sp. M2D.F.Ca.ET.185.01.1.1]|uniref:class I SAM-dependent methyltransferase n=1 Tax=unclassified Mesorhizobium TaxID=325217 RepID=UPI000FCC3DD9|nr:MULTISPECIES: class I SAM-dependent methyltransferase [unclassified Mesorhizobium]TGP77483.1 class I SAM-dependent methyltransferase [bacterium M00.F.Ca.ET.227.01.1.1]TGP93278.1 class I SAM-dependent methyltransferase [bacterium M00.F.Ca.ET.222.01.1.1]TGP96824.1 class I SAM-dependent methyltransferase [bacterium M00.F.Ca.ET.221.01.1.1]TGU21241.1 class I SAM-dependent methyltransferase [bacterium M00.F.Ca.ET.156.01.1.1]TGU50036.1 class I SAM-dependent methyltransferase [bacterium M00.F.Ca.ET
MATETKGSRNWFDQGGRDYARFRPEYPLAIARFLAEAAPMRRRAVDVGCGNGQLTTQLADHFDEAIGLDPSADQIANVMIHQRVRYICAPAENIPLPDRSADVITAAQAAHWFDLPHFYEEVRRISCDNALIALISYGVLQFGSPELNERFNQFYRQEIGPYWPPERKLVDTGYATIPFPFSELQPPQLFIDRNWELRDFLGYISTWSATRRVIEAGREDILERFVTDLSRHWGEGEQPVTWPVNMRLGRL